MSLAAASAALALLTSGVAIASWSVGDGLGAATAGTPIALTTVVATAPTTNLLYPSGPAASLK
ncbi:MAG: hypothetical protein H0V67_08865, partial [Geodermatophilaceae bacterium]|nr:hypothetical protein [Geodermatophilaceae bacterium]